MSTQNRVGPRYPAAMEKQYCVEFFSSFIDNLQRCSQKCVPYKQLVEVTGYLSLEIDGIKKERYVLSELVQNTGNVISESYCTKVSRNCNIGGKPFLSHGPDNSMKHNPTSTLSYGPQKQSQIPIKTNQSMKVHPSQQMVRPFGNSQNFQRSNNSVARRQGPVQNAPKIHSAVSFQGNNAISRRSSAPVTSSSHTAQMSQFHSKPGRELTENSAKTFQTDPSRNELLKNMNAQTLNRGSNENLKRSGMSSRDQINQIGPHIQHPNIRNDRKNDGRYVNVVGNTLKVEKSQGDEDVLVTGVTPPGTRKERSGQFPQPPKVSSGHFQQPSSVSSAQCPQTSSVSSRQLTRTISVPSGQYPQHPQVSSRQFPQPTSVSSGQFSQPTSVSSGQYSQPPQVSSGQFSQPTSVSSGQFPQPTSVSSGKFSQPTSVSSGQFLQPTSVSPVQPSQPTQVPHGQFSQPTSISSGQFSQPAAQVPHGQFSQPAAQVSHGQFSQPPQVSSRQVSVHPVQPTGVVLPKQVRLLKQQYSTAAQGSPQSEQCQSPQAMGSQPGQLLKQMNRVEVQQPERSHFSQPTGLVRPQVVNTVEPDGRGKSPQYYVRQTFEPDKLQQPDHCTQREQATSQKCNDESPQPDQGQRVTDIPKVKQPRGALKRVVFVDQPGKLDKDPPLLEKIDSVKPTPLDCSAEPSPPNLQRQTTNNKVVTDSKISIPKLEVPSRMLLVNTQGQIQDITRPYVNLVGLSNAVKFEKVNTTKTEVKQIDSGMAVTGGTSKIPPSKEQGHFEPPNVKEMKSPVHVNSKNMKCQQDSNVHTAENSHVMAVDLRYFKDNCDHSEMPTLTSAEASEAKDAREACASEEPSNLPADNAPVHTQIKPPPKKRVKKRKHPDNNTTEKTTSVTLPHSKKAGVKGKGTARGKGKGRGRSRKKPKSSKFVNDDESDEGEAEMDVEPTNRTLRNRSSAKKKYTEDDCLSDSIAQYYEDNSEEEEASVK